MVTVVLRKTRDSTSKRASGLTLTHTHTEKKKKEKEEEGLTLTIHTFSPLVRTNPVTGWKSEDHSSPECLTQRP